MLYRGGSQRNSVEYCQANTGLSLGWGGLGDIGYPGQGQEFGSCSVQLKFKRPLGDGREGAIRSSRILYTCQGLWTFN